MISIAQLQSLEFEYEEMLDTWSFKDILIYFVDGEKVVDLNAFQLYGIRDIRDLRKLIELVYGKE
jgi:hypothetical protein